MWVEGLGMQLRYTRTRPPYSLEGLFRLARYDTFKSGSKHDGPRISGVSFRA